MQPELEAEISPLSRVFVPQHPPALWEEQRHRSSGEELEIWVGFRHYQKDEARPAGERPRPLAPALVLGVVLLPEEPRLVVVLNDVPATRKTKKTKTMPMKKAAPMEIQSWEERERERDVAHRIKFPRSSS